MKYKLGIVTAIADEQGGQIFPFCKKDSRYEGEITEIKDKIAVVFREDSGTWLFNLDGSCSSHAGMSLVPNYFGKGERVTMVVHEDIEGIRKIKAGSYNGIVDYVNKDIVSINVLDGEWTFNVSTLENIYWNEKVTLHRNTHSSSLKSSVNITKGLQMWVGDKIVMVVEESSPAHERYPNREYEGEVVDTYKGNTKIRLLDGKEWWFDHQGFCGGDPSMSIHPAKPQGTKVITASFSRCEQCGAKDFVEKHECTQWVEGKVPIGYKGHVWLCGGEFTYVALKEKKKGENATIVNYTHWKPAKIPSPPAKIKAFGYLVWWKNWSEISDYAKGISPDDVATFYSELATGENLRKYFKIIQKGIEVHISGYGHMTLDQFISYYMGYHNKDELLFTSETLKILGIK